jgi:predicted DNA-binding protein (MmcQ/YjbR family)
MTHSEFDTFFLSFPNTWLDFPFGEGTSVYKVGEKGSEHASMFALIANDSKPLRVSLRCDPILAKTLREKYETVVPASDLNRKNWNTIIVTGQLTNSEIKDLANLSYQLATA